MAKTITAANAVIMITIPGLYPVPQQLQGFATDDVYDVEAVESGETVMGVDGHMSAGFINYKVAQKFMLMPDSPSILILEALIAAEKAQQDKYFLQASTRLKSVGYTYTQVNGVLRRHSPMPSAKKLLQAREFTFEWEQIVALPVA